MLPSPSVASMSAPISIMSSAAFSAPWAAHAWSGVRPSLSTTWTRAASVRRRFATASTFECDEVHARWSGERPRESAAPRGIPLSMSQSMSLVTGADASLGALIPPTIA